MSEDLFAPNQRRNAIWMIIAITAAMGLAAILVVHVSQSNAGGASEFLFVAVFGEDTSYAPGYTERGFIELALGSDETTVLATLGEPLRRGRLKASQVDWYYAESPRSRNYRVRVVRFENGKVAEKLASYYWD